MPMWKQPFWYWIKWFKAWPFHIEALSGFFDFNHAPFFQSFVGCGLNDPRGASFSLSTASAIRCNGAICRSAGRCFHRADRSTIGLNSSCQWTANSAKCGVRVTPISRLEE
jgi:hypothetical protein